MIVSAEALFSALVDAAVPSSAIKEIFLALFTEEGVLRVKRAREREGNRLQAQLRELSTLSTDSYFHFTENELDAAVTAFRNSFHCS